MPVLTQTEVIITIDWNENINADENKLRVYRLLKTIEPETVQSNSLIGRQQFLLNRDKEMSPSEARIYVKTDSPGNVEKIENKVKKFIVEEYNKALFGFEPPTSIFEKLFTSSEPPLVAELSMLNPDIEPDIPSLIKTCRELNGDRTLFSSNKIPFQEHLVLTVDLEKLLLYNVSYNALLKELKTAFNENTIGHCVLFKDLFR